ncbi:DUF6114 domain-containing protein [Streptomyces sp. 549]|uniref:DUF6114 domain-containing protein n=1 Tax=Streptomyces sp. 549 TaxID=3049076 RepID=UPI0024C431EE|nr:DUF6114 domain-containing protein [Streptomyces sp. 549]MDK1474898.1 DUF6114 domain-containing protein [Streptomyces sp. 549]
MSAESLGTPSRVGHWRRSFRHWRWQRPFWAGLLTLLAGLPIVWIPYADPSLEDLSFRLATTTGSGSLIIGVLLVVLGLTLWYQPHGRVFAGVAAILLALVSLVVSNIGGYLVGFLLALVGGAMAVSWAPGDASAKARDTRPVEPAEPAEPVGPRPVVEPAAGTAPAAAVDTATAVGTDNRAVSAGNEAGPADGGTRAG